MILNVYNIRDERVGTYGVPIVTDKLPDQVASDYQTSVDRLAANIERYQQFAPEKAAELLLTSASLKDCVIYQVGTFDNKTGKIEMIEPVMVCRVSDFYREVSNNA